MASAGNFFLTFTSMKTWKGIYGWFSSSSALQGTEKETSKQSEQAKRAYQRQQTANSTKIPPLTEEMSLTKQDFFFCFVYYFIDFFLFPVLLSSIIIFFFCLLRLLRAPRGVQRCHKKGRKAEEDG